MFLAHAVALRIEMDAGGCDDRREQKRGARGWHWHEDLNYLDGASD
jgi:hypothetical protein